MIKLLITAIFLISCQTKGSEQKNVSDSKNNTIILIDREKLSDLMHEYNVGVQIKNTYKVREIDLDFFESE
ncbi:MAG: hypothetical protein ACE364_08155 [Chlorobiota bacterium]